jgi:chromosome segregation ATPase
MTTIIITVPGEELENLSIELTSEEVTALYKLRKDNAVRVAELEKKLKDAETNLKYAQDGRTEAQNELSQANTLLSALGIAEKTNEEESYYRKPLPVVARIALYIANVKGT